MTAFRGLTWDHPRGRDALQAAAAAFTAEGPDTLTWDVHPLEGFESTPIEELAERYDLVVLDHPHLGDALAADCLRPLDELFPAEELAAWAEAAVGPSAESYSLADRTWALPLDAATQVSARRPDLLEEAPAEWADALALARGGGVAPSLAGPHAFLSLCSIAVAVGAAPGSSSEELMPRDAARVAFDILEELARQAPASTADLNPIGLLERMSSTDDLCCIPLVYGYVTYSAADRARPIAFAAPPSLGGRIGSTIGGTGIAVSRRAAPTETLLAHLGWLMSGEFQRGFLPEHSGQPSSRAAWTDTRVNAAAGDFYRATLPTIDASWVRPRFAGYVPFQSAASAALHAALTGDDSRAAARDAALDAVDELYRSARSDATSKERISS